jgi:hypothetical protein
MPAIFDLLYREYCRARLTEMRKQLLISPERHEVPEAVCDGKDAVGAGPASHPAGGRQEAPPQAQLRPTHANDFVSPCVTRKK